MLPLQSGQSLIGPLSGTSKMGVFISTIDAKSVDSRASILIKLCCLTNIPLHDIQSIVGAVSYVPDLRAVLHLGQFIYSFFNWHYQLIVIQSVR